jgi:Fe-S oxidoreductase
MNPTIMLILLVSAWAAFGWTASRRRRLLKIGRPENRLDDIGKRIRVVLEYGVLQKKLGYYPVAGLGHKLIFLGFAVLLLRSLILWGRGFDPAFHFWLFGDEPVDLPGLGALPIGHAYEFVKDVFATLVLVGVSVFFYYRVVRPQKRMTLHPEGLLILGIIAVMMIADMAYDGASMVLRYQAAAVGCGAAGKAVAEVCTQAGTVLAQFATQPERGETLAYAFWPSPAGSLFALLLSGLGPSTLVLVAHAGFWTHSSLVLIFLNVLPYTKHFHIITALPNVFLADTAPAGRLPPMAKSSDELMEIVGAAAEKSDPMEAPIGVARIDHLTWKGLLDLYSCTECGRCTDNCPANRTGKTLSPKKLTLDLRDHLYAHEKDLVGRANPIDLVDGVIKPEVLWACTTCRACEEQCPVMISYVDKIASMRRNLVLVKGEIPNELSKPFQAMEVNGNPWNLARIDRAAWAEGLDIPLMSQRPTAKVLFWVGCAPSYDDRAKKIARATVRLMKAAGVDFAILGSEESCTGDSARRAGNEYLFMTLAEGNIATINRYREKGGIEKIVTACPHCFNTLKNEYPDLGGKYDVVHHTELLLDLVDKKKIVPIKTVQGKAVLHDACYLGRYNGIYDPPRELMRRIPGLELVEAEMNKNRGLCCGAGGAQMWMEEQNKDRMNVRRTKDLVLTGAKTVLTACPFCQTMITDGLKAEGLEEEIRQLDVVELLEQSCDLSFGQGLQAQRPQM